MTSASLFLKNKYLLVLSVLVIFVAGFSAFVSMPRLEDPRIVNRNPLIVTLVPGASAERVEALVTEKLEEKLQEVSEIKELRSTSRAGVSIIAVELADRVYDSQKVFSLMRDKIAEAEPELPREASTPLLDDQRGPVAYSLIVGVVWEHDSEPKLGILNRLAEDVADQLRTIAGTENVRLFGAPREEITVIVDPSELAALGMTPSDLAASIRAADSKIPAGMLRSGRDDLILEVAGSLDSLARIGRIPLREGSDGTLLRLSDIARAERDWQSPPQEIGLADGRRAVYVGAKVHPHRRVDEWAEEALEIVDAFGAGVGDGVAIEVVFDQTRYTNERLAELGLNLLAGALVVVVVIFFVMGWRSSIVVASALPLTAAIALFGTALTGGALHQISIFGMVVALGLLIDNAIVVVDEVRKHLDRGDAPAEAVSGAVHHLFVPLLASTLTTVLAFAPIVLLPGSVGDFVRSVGGSVILALVASFALAMTVVPALAGWLAEARPEVEKRSWWRSGVGNERFAGITRRGLVRGLRVPIMMLALASLLPAAGFVASRSLGSQFFPPVDRDMFDLKLWLKSEAAIERTRTEVEAIEALLREDPAIRRVDWLIGASFPSVYYNAVMNQDDARHHAQAVVTANSSEEVKRLIPKIQRRLDEAFPGAQIVLSQFAQGPPVEADVEFRLYGPSIETLQNLGDELRLRLAEHPGVLHSQATMGRGEPKLWLDANEDEARLAGLSLSDIATQLQGSLEGTLGGSVIEDSEELDVRIRFEDERRRQLFDIASTPLTAAGRSGWTPLSVLGELALRPEVSALTRHDGLRANLIHGYTRNGALAIDVTDDVLTELEESGFLLPSGYRLAIGGDAEEENKALGNLMIYLPVLLTLMVATIVLTFRSVRLAVVLGVVAVQSIGLGLLATWAYGFPVSFTTILGTLGLIGVALNDSIVVLAAIRSNPAARRGEVEAMADEVVGTLRHVISTTLTTVGGFLPLLIFVGGDFWPPLAIVLAGGVSGATILAVVFVPAAYRLVMTASFDFRWLTELGRFAPLFSTKRVQS